MFDIIGGLVKRVSSLFSGSSARRTAESSKTQTRISGSTGGEAEGVHKSTYSGIAYDAALRRAASSAPPSSSKPKTSAGGASRTSSKTSGAPAGIAHDAALRRAASSSSTRTQTRTSTPSKPAPSKPATSSKPAASHSRPTRVSYTVSAPTITHRTHHRTRHPAQKPEPKPQPKPQTTQAKPTRVKQPPVPQEVIHGLAPQPDVNREEQANQEFRRLISQGKSPEETASVIEQKYGTKVTIHKLEPKQEQVTKETALKLEKQAPVKVEIPDTPYVPFLSELGLIPRQQPPHGYRETINNPEAIEGAKRIDASYRSFEPTAKEKALLSPEKPLHERVMAAVALGVWGKDFEKVAELPEKLKTPDKAAQELAASGGLVGGTVGFGLGMATVVGKAAGGDILGAGRDVVVGSFEWVGTAPARLLSGSPSQVGALAGETLAMSVTGKAITKAGEYTPLPRRAQLVEIAGGRTANPALKPIRFGWTFATSKTPLLTVVRTAEGIKVSKGAAPAPVDVLAGKRVTAYSPLETRFFAKTAEAFGEKEVFSSGYKVAKEVYSTDRPLFEPEGFEVLSEAIPEKARTPVKEAIKSYKGDVTVYGSVTQKLQLKEYMSRQPKDIEVIVDDPTKFTQHLEKHLKESGVSYEVKMGQGKAKVYIEGEKAIEIFSKDRRAFDVEEEAYYPTYDIAYAFRRQSPMEAEGVNLLKTSEQAARKFEGATVLRVEEGVGRIEPKHEGRVKDIRDLIEIGTGYAVEKGLRIETELISYAKEMARRYPEIKESPVVRLLVEEERLPTRSELVRMVDEIDAKVELFRKTRAERTSSLLGFEESSIIPLVARKGSSITRPAKESSYIRGKGRRGSSILIVDEGSSITSSRREVAGQA